MSYKKISRWAGIFIFNLLLSSSYAQNATFDEAKTIAENWLRYIVGRDGSWAGSVNPSVYSFAEFARGGELLGYYASVQPRGYIIVSMIKDFAPIKAYSTVSNLDPDVEEGMCDLLKDVLESRNNFLVESFGGLDDESLQDLPKFTSEASRKAWSFLLAGGSSLSEGMKSIESATAGAVGPLLQSKWGQGIPFNDDCPVMDDCPHALVGCAPLAIAQIMRYFCWPPFFESSYYDWPNLLVNVAEIKGSNWYVDENDVTWTQAQIDAVADLCYDAGKVLGSIDYGCESTSAATCSDFYHDARDAFEEDFLYDTEDDEPDCEYHDDNDYDEWWGIIRDEIDHNRPMMYRISNDEDDNDFAHVIVVDGYDDTGGQHKVHANYGWSGDWHDNWYDLDWFDCDNAAGWNLRCEWDEEYMVRNIYPRNGISEWYTGTLGAWGGAGTLHHYIYNDTYSNNLTVEGGARVQFLSGVKLICNGNSINIDGGSQYETRFFSNGIPTHGLKVAEGGTIKLLPDGSIGVH